VCGRRGAPSAGHNTCRRRLRPDRTHPFKSNTVTRLPTGLMSVLPSGVNVKLPQRYTVPHKLLNLKAYFIVVLALRRNH